MNQANSKNLRRCYELTLYAVILKQVIQVIVLFRDNACVPMSEQSYSTWNSCDKQQYSSTQQN